MALTKINDRGLETPIDLQDNEKIRLGTGNDLELFHDGSASNIKDTGTGHINLWSNEVRMIDAGGSEYMFRAFENGAVELYHDNVKSLSTDATGCTIQKDASNVSAALTIKATNGGQAKLDLMTSLSGTNRAARIDFHNQGTNQWTIINDYQQNGTNNLGIRHDAEKAIDIYPDGAVELYYDNSKKFETIADGIKVTDYIKFNGVNCGVDFGSTSNAAGMTSEVLDDYEEGTWTPVMKKYVNSSWVNATMTSNGTVQVAKYTKVGNKVQVYLFWDGWQQSDANYSVIGGLPFASNGGGIIIPAYNNAFTAMQNQGGLIGHQSDNVSFYYDGTNWNAWSSGSARTLYFGGFYFAT